MFKLVAFVALLTFQVSTIASLKTVSSHLNSNDLIRLQKVFGEGLSSSDLQSIYYSSLNIEPTNAGDKNKFCSALQKAHADSKLNDFEKNLYLVGSHKNLRCTGKIPQAVLDKVTSSLTKDATTAAEIFYNLYASKAIGVSIDAATSQKLSKNLQTILKKDDSLTSLGYAFYIASELGVPAAFVADRVEDAIVQADEVDGKMLQFEGGLSITALVISGALKVAKVNNKPTPITHEQAVKFATYFLSRRSVQTAKGAYALIESLKTLAADSKVAPICIQVIGNAQLQSDSPVLTINAVDLLGKPLSPALAGVSGKVVLKKGNTVLAEKVSFVSKSSDKTTFSADLSSYKPTRGIYTAEITAGGFSQSLSFKVLGKVTVNALEIGVGDSDATSALKKQAITFPNKVSDVLSADHTQKLVLKAVLIDEVTSKVISVHQAFVRLVNLKTDEEIIFVAEQDTSKAYKFDMDVGSRAGEFGHQSGIYKVELIIGDSSISNSFQWHVADIQLKFAQESKGDISSLNTRQPLAEIEHQFRQPDKRPPRFVSDIFTGLCLTPLVLLFIIWGKLGINVSNFSLSLSTIGFHVGFGAILALFGIFWLQLNMFQTIRYLIPIAIFTFLCGNRLLRTIAGLKTTGSSST